MLCAASVVIFDIHALQERFYFGDQVGSYVSYIV